MLSIHAVCCAHTDLTAAQRAREQTLLTAIALDTEINCPQVAVAIWSGFLMTLAKLVRAVLLVALRVFVFRILRRDNRRQLSRYEFGSGRLGQFARTVDGDGQATFDSILARHFDAYTGLAHVRASRIGGGALVISRRLAFATLLSAVQRAMATVSSEVAELVPGVRVTVAPSAAPGR